jgi:hypothetical protein
MPRGIEMIIVRTVLQASFGKGGELAAQFVASAPRFRAELGVESRWRVLTDLSGSFDTVVQEVEAENLAQWEQERSKLFQAPAFRESFGRIQGLVVSGRNELWTIEGEG